MAPIDFTGKGLAVAMDAELTASFRESLHALTRLRYEHLDRTFREAILKAEGGVWPGDETLRANGQIVIDHENVYHLLWKASKTSIGEKPDMTKCIASVAPPKFYLP
jgi:hypothetical protein